MTKKLLAILLAVLMLSGILASCGETSSGGKSGSRKSASTESESGSGREDNETLKVLQPEPSKDEKPSATTGADDKNEPSQDKPNWNDPYAYINEYVESLAAERTFDGATFTILGRGLSENDGGYTHNGAFPMAEELIGSLENDALFNRQKALEDIFDIDIVTANVERGDYDGPGVPTALLVIDAVNAGLPTYDLVDGNISIAGKYLLEKNALMEVHELEAVDFSQSWWLNDLEDQLSMNGGLYFLAGKISTQHYSDASCILFNKRVAEDYAIEEPYEAVKSGKWTFDKMNEIASVIQGGGDTYRYMLWWGDALSFYFGAGYSITEKDSSDIPSVASSLPNEAADYIHKLGSVFGDTDISYNYLKPAAYGATSWADMEENRDMFNEEKVLFWVTDMGTIAEMRQYDVEFGILPIPKRDASQKEYISYTQAGVVSAFYVPSNVKDPTMVGYVVEGMAALSEKYLEPAYYEISLVQRGVYDMDSKEMLDIIYTTKKLDMADIFGFGDIANLIDNNCNGSKEDLAAEYASKVKIANNSVKSLLKAVVSNK